MNPTAATNALLLVGGGARAAYQVGVLRSMARAFPKLNFPVLTGVSAGAINIALLANTADDFPRTIEKLVTLWNKLTIDQVFRTEFSSVGSKMLRWVVRLATGRARCAPPLREIVDSAPLRRFLMRALETHDGSLPGIEANFRHGRLSAVGMTTTKYPTGESTTWVDGLDVEPWKRAGRCGVPSRLTVEHIMASSALPMIFPAVELADGWYGDGGMRLTEPLSPAVHLGADRIVAVSTLTAPGRAETNTPFHSYPPPATVLGVLLDSVFLDMLDADALEMRQLNQLIADNPRSKEFGLRPVDVLVIRPSEDLGALAREFEPELPRTLRHFFRALGSQESNRSDVIATLLFQPRYLRRAMEIGEKDGRERRDELAAFLGFDGSPSRESSAPMLQTNGHHAHEAVAADSLFTAAPTGTHD